MRRLTDYLGYRGTVLVIIGLFQAAQGCSYVLARTKGRDQGFAWIEAVPFIPSSVGSQQAGWLMLTAGVIVVTLAVFGKQRPGFQRWGFNVAIIPWALWTMVFLTAWILGTHPSGLASSISYAGWTVIVYFLGGWPETEETLADTVRQEGNADDS